VFRFLPFFDVFAANPNPLVTSLVPLADGGGELLLGNSLPDPLWGIVYSSQLLPHSLEQEEEFCWVEVR
jgi:hypothetical protein